MKINLFNKGSEANAEQVTKIKQWVVDELSLGEKAVVMVSELQCKEEGCPPIETVIAIMGVPYKSLKFKLHKFVQDITQEDIKTLNMTQGGHDE